MCYLHVLLDILLLGKFFATGGTLHLGPVDLPPMLLHLNLNFETKEFKNIIYESFATIDRLSKEEMKKNEEVLKGIMKFHQIYIDSSGKLKGKELSCLTCTVRYRCADCK